MIALAQAQGLTESFVIRDLLPGDLGISDWCLCGELTNFTTPPNYTVLALTGVILTSGFTKATTLTIHRGPNVVHISSLWPFRAMKTLSPDGAERAANRKELEVAKRVLARVSDTPLNRLPRLEPFRDFLMVGYFAEPILFPPNSFGSIRVDESLLDEESILTGFVLEPEGYRIK